MVRYDFVHDDKFSLRKWIGCVRIANVSTGVPGRCLTGSARRYVLVQEDTFEEVWARGGKLSLELEMLGPHDVWSTFRSLEDEEARLSTFGGWPVTFIQPKDLVRSGFVYAKYRDYVTCVYCHCTLGHWVDGDDPEAEHRRLIPHCKRGGQIRSCDISWKYSQDIYSLRSWDLSQLNLSEPLLRPEQIQHPRYQCPIRRLISFNTPFDHLYQMVNAGFFSCGLS